MLDTCTGINLHGPTTLTLTQAQFPFAQATITAVTDALHYTIQARPRPACLASLVASSIIFLEERMSSESEDACYQNEYCNCAARHETGLKSMPMVLHIC